ncbi:MAG: trypsin-like serine protease [Labilithrix sp.]|nr:trypsin-like serine protease [Labilithrix sp.]MCW5814578.1 trypsin-like serine protease [Labilithrix sp.]
MRTVLAGFIIVVVAGCIAPPEEPDRAAAEIVGGAATLRYPFVVGVGGRNGAYCSGTVVARRAVLTAGHCVSRGIRKVYLGPTLDDRAPEIAVVKVTRHPRYAEVRLASGAIGGATNDLAVLELAADAPVQPAPLFRGTLENSARFVGPELVFVGYGAIDGSGLGFGTRREASFPIAKVGPAAVGGTPGTIDASMIYYAVPGKSACRGDSGGPAFFVEGGVLSIAAVTSFGGPRCESDGVHARADAPQIAAFLQAELDRIEAADPCRPDGVCGPECGVRDPDCLADHCGADGVCAEACVADPDCESPR